MVKSGLNATVDESDAGVRGSMPGYIYLYNEGELLKRAETLEAKLSACALCPRACGVDRNKGKLGFCGIDSHLKIAAINLHHWEEPPISGTRGSGTIFFSGCTLKCVFCQNYPISQLGVGQTMSTEDLASGMLRLQKRGAHNINLVTSTHQMAAVARALLLAVPRGLHIPLVYNSSGYESLETLRLLDGIIDIYLPDIKYSESKTSQKYSGAGDYVEINRQALLEMWRQVGRIRTDANGIAYRGMIVRHMVLPEDLSGTRDSLSYLARRIGPEIWISLMNQYFPAYKGHELPPLDRKVSEGEYEAAFQALTEFGLLNGFVQDCE
jgi:putative pyruvate formate lyase activating enzyme